jgi:hypothetical protein
MLNFSIMHPEGILLIRPSAPLSKEDFDSLSAGVDAYLSGHAKLRGVMIHAKAFPGWENFGAFTSTCTLSANTISGSSALPW